MSDGVEVLLFSWRSEKREPESFDHLISKRYFKLGTYRGVYRLEESDGVLLIFPSC